MVFTKSVMTGHQKECGDCSSQNVCPFCNIHVVEKDFCNSVSKVKSVFLKSVVVGLIKSVFSMLLLRSGKADFSFMARVKFL